MRAPLVPVAEPFSSLPTSTWVAETPAAVNSPVQMAADSVSFGIPWAGSPMKHET